MPFFISVKRGGITDRVITNKTVMMTKNDDVNAE